MPTKTFPPDTYLSFEYYFRGNGIIRFYIESELPIHVYILNDINFKKLKAGRDFVTHWEFRNRQENRQELRMPHGGYWYLVIYNPQDESCAVHYDVYE